MFPSDMEKHLRGAVVTQAAFAPLLPDMDFPRGDYTLTIFLEVTRPEIFLNQ